MDPDEKRPYAVREQSGHYEVINASGRVVMVCRDLPSAEGYTVLLNEAYRLGYKAGYRAGKAK